MGRNIMSPDENALAPTISIAVTSSLTSPESIDVTKGTEPLPPNTTVQHDHNDQIQHDAVEQNDDQHQYPTSTSPCHIHDEEDNEDDREYHEFVRKWKESPFAIGLSYTTWFEEKAICCFSFQLFLLKYGCYDHWFCCCRCVDAMKQVLLKQQQQQQQQRNRRRRYRTTKNNANVACTACLCQYTPFGRVGNMLILYQTIHHDFHGNEGNNQDNNHDCRFHGNSNNQPNRNDIHHITRPKLYLVMGPYWMVASCITLPVMVGLTFWIGITKIPYYQLAVKVTWSFCAVIMIVSFLLVACTDPGIQYRYRNRPQMSHDNGMDSENRSPPVATRFRTIMANRPNVVINNQISNTNQTMADNEWVWNDQVLSYRLRTATYDPECAVVIDKLDHVCPWTGTAIGSKNICSFRLFCFFVIVNIIYDAYLLIC
jgi:DHHC palmitoyltransferase